MKFITIILVVCAILVSIKIIISKDTRATTCNAFPTPVNLDWRFKDLKHLGFHNFTKVCRHGHIYWKHNEMLLSIPALNNCEQLIRCKKDK